MIDGIDAVLDGLAALVALGGILLVVGMVYFGGGLGLNSVILELVVLGLGLLCFASGSVYLLRSDSGLSDRLFGSLRELFLSS